MWSFIYTVAILFSVKGFAKSDYVQTKECGTATVVSGDTCSNVKVEFKFNGCDVPHGPQIAQRIICVGTKIKARFQEGNQRFEAEFNKENDSWGTVSWRSLGPVSKWEKQTATVAKTKVDVESDRAPAKIPDQPQPTFLSEPKTSAPTTEGSKEDAGVFKFSGFFDFRYTNYAAKNSPSVVDAHAQSGFGLEDGALYASYERGNISIIADLPVRRAKDIDYSASATYPQQSNGPAIKLGGDKAQVFLKYKFSDEFNVNIGQFDTFFGYEFNDSKDRVFGKTGVVFAEMIPNTHTGVMAEYNKNGYYAKVMAANPNGKGSYGTSTNSDENTEYGSAIGFNKDWIRAQAGYLVRPIAKASRSDMGTRSLADALLGFTFGRFTIDFEFSVIDDPSKDTLTPGNSLDGETPGTGFLALPTYKLSESMLLAVRYEHLEHDPSSMGILSADSKGISFHYKVNTNLSLRSEYIGTDYRKAVTDQRWNENRWITSVLVSF